MATVTPKHPLLYGPMPSETIFTEHKVKRFLSYSHSIFLLFTGVLLARTLSLPSVLN